MRRTSIAGLALLAVMAAPACLARTVPAQTTPAAAPSGQDWNPVSRSATRVYLVDVNGITVNGDVTRITLARVPLHPPSPVDQSYVVVEMEYRCGAGQSRAVAEIEHDETGAALDRFETGEDFAPYSPQALDGYVAAVVCDGDRATPPTFPSIPAFIAAGRP